MSSTNIVKQPIWLISQHTAKLWPKESGRQQGNRSRRRAQLKAFVRPFMQEKVVHPFTVCFSQNRCLLIVVRRFVIVLT